jgi:hypothetical protein
VPLFSLIPNDYDDEDDDDDDDDMMMMIPSKQNRCYKKIQVTSNNKSNHDILPS